MQVEKNIFDNVIYTVMDSDRTQDNQKAMMDQADLCRWLQELRLLDGYASNLSRLYEGIHGTGDMQHFSKWFQAYVNDPIHGVSDPQILNLAYGPLREYTSWTMTKVRSNWRVAIKCKPEGRIESPDEVVQDEAYQNIEEIPVRLITKTEILESLRTPAGEVDIVIAQVNQRNNIENKDEIVEDDGTNKDNGSESADSHSSQDNE
ncbi:hypothetical protein PIB30_059871 [Stylosanthes scabra]|uniref:Uncharacterized protein n=1 Tax=Stylosanthes scabra TaxID=79078 RepID=A0ABU6TK56_9FABA|nr:hypothetical protein [Stylosanthes scabra]